MGFIFWIMIIFYKHVVPTGLKQTKLRRSELFIEIGTIIITLAL